MKHIFGGALILTAFTLSAQNDLESFGSSWTSATRWTFLAFMVVSVILALRTFRNKPDA